MTSKSRRGETSVVYAFVLVFARCNATHETHVIQFSLSLSLPHGVPLHRLPHHSLSSPLLLMLIVLLSSADNLHEKTRSNLGFCLSRLLEEKRRQFEQEKQQYETSRSS